MKPTSRQKSKNGSLSNTEFEGGFIRVSSAEIIFLLECLRDKKLNIDMFRVWAALKESGFVNHHFNKESEYVTLLKQGKKRISNKKILTCFSKLRDLDEIFVRYIDLRIVKYTAMIPRKVLKTIFSGMFNKSQIAVLLFYFMRRKPQRGKKLKNLSRGQKYARFKYPELRVITGFTDANICIAVNDLVKREAISLVKVPRRNMNEYGHCFVDGRKIMLKNNNTLGISSNAKINNTLRVANFGDNRKNNNDRTEINIQLCQNQ